MLKIDIDMKIDLKKAHVVCGKNTASPIDLKARCP